MRPVLQNNRINRKLWILYGFIIAICIIGIGVTLYLQVFKDENLGAAVGITSDSSEEEDEYNDLRSEFDTLFTNQTNNLQENLNIEKIVDKYDIVFSPYNYQKEDENSEINVSIPQININNNSVKAFNTKLQEKYKSTAEMFVNQVSNINLVYTIDYVAYIQNNILSLVMRINFKEGSKSQKTKIETFNYNIAEGREVTLEEILSLKGITVDEAEEKVKTEIQKTQEKNQNLIESGYSIYQRDYTSDMYKISNAKNFLYGKDGMLYLIYAYGNDEDTSEKDIVIFK